MQNYILRKLEQSINIERSQRQEMVWTVGGLTKKVIVIIDSNNQIFIDIMEGQQLFVFNSQCKMQVIFSTKQIETCVMSINFFMDQKLMGTLNGQNKAFLSSIYKSLNLILSHKGINDYLQPIKRIGKGGFATVYLVESKINGQKLAAKVFAKEGHKTTFKGKQALENQIKVLRTLNHTNILRFKGIYETDNLIYVVTEYLDGGTLQSLMRSRFDLKGEEIISIIRGVLEGLKYLGEKKLMHRDIKPANIIQRKADKQWVICDLGLIAKSDELYLFNKCGSLGYMAPQIRSITEQNMLRYSEQCDIYSLGVIAYNLMTGSPPFRLQKQNLYDFRVVEQRLITKDFPEFDNSLLEFLNNLMENNPSKRVTAKQALQSSVLFDKKLADLLTEYQQKRISQRYTTMLKVSNK